MSFLKKVFKKNVGGYIKAYNLEEWWENSFDKKEQEYIISIFNPYIATNDKKSEENKKTLVEGNPNVTRESKHYFLAVLASWFDNKKDFGIAKKMILESNKQFENSLISDENFTEIPEDEDHFYYARLINIYYHDRENEESFNLAIESCENQINISKKTKEYFLKEFDKSLPGHTGFKQLAIIEEKRRNFERAMELSKRAKEEGWAGDWEKRIIRLEKKMQ